MSTRMLTQLEKLKANSNAQGGWRKNRSTTQKINTLIGAIKEAQKENSEIHLVYVNLKKAYDSVDHEMLYNTLENFGFDQKTVQIIKAMNTGNTCEVITAWGKTDAYPIECGVRQGCPLSPLLFMI